MSAATPCYVGVSRAPCGHWIAAMVEESNVPRELWDRKIAKEIAEWARRGLIVERHSVAEVRERLDWCEQCCPSKAKRRADARAVQTALPLGGREP